MTITLTREDIASLIAEYGPTKFPALAGIGKEVRIEFKYQGSRTWVEVTANPLTAKEK